MHQPPELPGAESRRLLLLQPLVTPVGVPDAAVLRSCAHLPRSVQLEQLISVVSVVLERAVQPDAQLQLGKPGSRSAGN